MTNYCITESVRGEDLPSETSEIVNTSYGGGRCIRGGVAARRLRLKAKTRTCCDKLCLHHPVPRCLINKKEVRTFRTPVCKFLQEIINWWERSSRATTSLTLALGVKKLVVTMVPRTA